MIGTTTGARPLAHVRRFNHVGITVADLDVVTAFFAALGLEVEGRTLVEGEFLDTVCGIPDSRVEIVMLKPPDDGTCLKLASFVRPESVPGSPAAMTDELGLRNVSFEVNDLQAAVDWAASQGYGLVGGMGEYERQWQLPHLKWRARRAHAHQGRRERPQCTLPRWSLRRRRPRRSRHHHGGRRLKTLAQPAAPWLRSRAVVFS